MTEKRLTKEIAEQFLADDKSVDLREFTEVDDDAAMALLMHSQNNENDNQSGDVSVPGKQPMSDTSRVILVVIFALPGALLAGFLGLTLGLMDLAFGGHGVGGHGDKTTAFDVICGFSWLVFGGACVGASPGLILGLVLRVRWVLPFVGSAAGCLLGFAAVMRAEKFTVSPGAGFVLFGLVVGSVFCLSSRQEVDRQDCSGPSTY